MEGLFDKDFVPEAIAAGCVQKKLAYPYIKGYSKLLGGLLFYFRERENSRSVENGFG